MTPPTDTKDRAIYHQILSDMHRLQSLMLTLKSLDHDSTEEGLRAHFSREQNVILGKLSEWRGRRPHIYQQAGDDFERYREAGKDS